MRPDPAAQPPPQPYAASSTFPESCVPIFVVRIPQDVKRMGKSYLTCIRHPLNSYLGDVIGLEWPAMENGFLSMEKIMLTLSHFSLKPVGARGLDYATLGKV